MGLVGSFVLAGVFGVSTTHVCQLEDLERILGIYMYGVQLAQTASNTASTCLPPSIAARSITSCPS